MSGENQQTSDPKTTQTDPKPVKGAAKKAAPKVKSAAAYKKLGLDPAVYGAK